MGLTTLQELTDNSYLGGKMAENGITLKLERWGHWKRDFVVGLGYPSSGMEQRLIENKGKVYNNGCYGGGKREDTKNKVSFKSDPESEKIDSMIKRLAVKHSQEMKILQLIYVLQWSMRKIRKESKCSRHTLGNYLEKGKRLIFASLEL